MVAVFRRSPLLIAVILLVSPCWAQTSAAPRPPLADVLNANADYTWFLNDRFGLFIHFGLYSNAARHEWVQSREQIPGAAYRKYFDTFNPDLFDASAWARAAKAAGMKYVVLTVKHHEGFCLFDSKLTDFKITNTAFKRDLVREYVDACRAAGLRIGFYYSLIDWHHPEFTLDGTHPDRDNLAAREASAKRDMAKYREYLHGQVRELLTQYGKIDYLWFDYSYSSQDWGWSKGKGAADWNSEELIRMIHSLQPHIILNNRLGIAGGGVQTPEQYQPRVTSAPRELKLIEECHTMNGSWGYDRDNLAWKSPEMLAMVLIDAVSKGHNLLINVGPTGRGEIDPRSTERLEQLGAWMRRHERAIHGAGPSEFDAPQGCRLTQRGDRLYVHLYQWPFKAVHLDGLLGKVRYAQFLHDGSEVRSRDILPKADNESGEVPAGTVELALPTVRPDVLIPVIEVWLK